jgi:sterol 3beta-glucosyltransferase
VAELGVGAAPIPRSQLTVERLAAAINQVMDDRSMQQRAAELGTRIRAEDGVAGAVAVIQELISQPSEQTNA